MDTGPISRADILDAAKDAVTRDRNRQYGEPEDLFAGIALAWSALDWIRGDRTETGADVAAKMVVLKACRAAANPSHIDSWTDMVGYAACGGEIAAGEPDPDEMDPEVQSEIDAAWTRGWEAALTTMLAAVGVSDSSGPTAVNPVRVEGE